ncbi:MAG: bifunctional enoyl-CoA hydratase/phosphate acetyltransferase [Bacteroidota bacterium]
MIGDFKQLMAHARALPTKVIALVHPAGAESFRAVGEALGALPVRFLLAGNEELIRAGMEREGVGGDAPLEILPAGSPAESARLAVTAAREGRADILMKGSVDTGGLLREVLREEGGLRMGRLLSDIVILEYAPRQGNRFLMITDGGVTLAPDLRNKMDLVRNAVELAHALGNPEPRVAVLSATEFVLPDLPSTLDAAALAKMNERGQIRGCLVDGPLALDNALSAEAAKEKGITSAVAGRAEILVAPNIEAANALAKGTTYFGGLLLAHVIVGGRVPVLIPSRADGSEARLLSMALGMVMSEHTQREES